MTNDGRSYPVFKFDQIIDTEIGLIKLIQDKYNDKNTFWWSLLEAPTKFKIGLLYDRKHPNPLTVIAKESDNIELLDDYYQQFMTEEYVYILKHSLATNIYSLIVEMKDIKGADPIIVCKNELEANYLRKINNAFKELNVIVTENFGSTIKDDSDIIYLKDIRESLPILDKIQYKNLYISSYRYNFIDDERTTLPNEYMVIMQGLVKVKTYAPYQEKDIVRGT